MRKVFDRRLQFGSLVGSIVSGTLSAMPEGASIWDGDGVPGVQKYGGMGGRTGLHAMWQRN